MQKIYFFKLPNLYFVMHEIYNYLNYKLILIENKTELKKLIDTDFIIILQKTTEIQIDDIDHNKILFIEKIPINIKKLLEKINIKFLKNQFIHQSKINIKDYILDLNSKIIRKKNTELKLTEKETQILLYLLNQQRPQNVKKLQLNIWGYQNDTETHTVETHVYRLRKKIYKSFKDRNFLISRNNGYAI